MLNRYSKRLHISFHTLAPKLALFSHKWCLMTELSKSQPCNVVFIVSSP